MTKRRFLLFLLLCIVLLGIVHWKVAGHQHHWDLSNLEMEVTDWNLDPISREEALALDRVLSVVDQENLSSDLKLLEDNALAETGKTLNYYRFTGRFSFPGEENVEGTVTTLVMVSQTENPYFYAIRKPQANVVCKHGDVIWTQMSSCSDIPIWNPRTARIEAKGYFAVHTGNPEIPEALSETLHPVYTVILE